MRIEVRSLVVVCEYGKTNGDLRCDRRATGEIVLNSKAIGRFCDRDLARLTAAMMDKSWKPHLQPSR
jgi:hypothetical protein